MAHSSRTRVEQGNYRSYLAQVARQSAFSGVDNWVVTLAGDESSRSEPARVGRSFHSQRSFDQPVVARDCTIARTRMDPSAFLSRMMAKRGVYENPARCRPAPGCARHRVPGFVPVRSSETHSIKAGEINIGVQTSHSERVWAIISAALIVGGIALTMAGALARQSKN